MGRLKGESNASYNARHREEQRRLMALGRTAEDRRKNAVELAAIDASEKPKVQVLDPDDDAGARSITPLLPKAHDTLLEAYGKLDRGEMSAKEVGYLASALRATAIAVRTAQNVVLRTDVQLFVDLVWDELSDATRRKLVKMLRGIDAATLLR